MNLRVAINLFYIFVIWQDLVEKVMVLRKAVEVSRGTAPAVSGGALADKLSQYAGLLAAQGSLSTALTYLNNSSDVSPLINTFFFSFHYFFVNTLMIDFT